jgi:hypothetical protein
MTKDATTIVSAQIAAALRAALEQRAQEGYRSVSAEIRMALAEHLRATEGEAT